MKASIVFFSFITILAKAEYPYESFGGTFNVSKSNYEVSNMPATKSQDGIGICYGFTSTTLLENYRCRTLNKNCLSKEENLSPLDVSSYGQSSNANLLKEGGFSKSVLSNIKNSDRKIVSESCLPYNSLVKKGDPRYVPNEFEGWKYLTLIWEKIKNQRSILSENQITCVAQNIKGKISGLVTPVSQLQSAIKTADSLESFLYKSIIPNHCLQSQNKLEIPNYDIKSYPESATSTTAELADKIENILLNNIPLEISICTDVQLDGKCKKDMGHSVTLFAIKEACNPLQECKRMVRIKNSYGWGWQRDNNDGWVDLMTLAKASKDLNKYGNITWLQKPGSSLSNFKLERTGYNVDSEISKPVPLPPAKPTPTPDKKKDFVGIYKCPNNTYLDHYEPGCIPYLDMK